LFGGFEIGRFVKFLLTLTNKKWPLGIDPGGHHFGLPSVAGKPGLLKETGVAPTRGKSIRIARALLVTAGSEGSDRK
jgi:hypothetical protein